MALLHGRVDLSNIGLMGRCHSGDAMIYLDVQAQPIIGNYTTHMFNTGNYSLLLDETTPIIDGYYDDV
jgi:hypothetical protein